MKPGKVFKVVRSDRKHGAKYVKATGDFRSPKAGEYFLSGAIIEGYYAPNDLPAKYWIAIPHEIKL